MNPLRIPLFYFLLLGILHAFAPDALASNDAPVSTWSQKSTAHPSIPAKTFSPRNRILIIGDSWAASIATKYSGGVGFGAFNSALAQNGFPSYLSDGATTAIAGRKAQNFALDPSYSSLITTALAANPDLVAIHLIIGGNDFLASAQNTNLYQAPWDAAMRDARWNQVQAYIQIIINLCRSVRPDIKIVIADYDYLNAAMATSAWGFTWGGMTQRQINDAFLELGLKKKALAEANPNCYYADNWGVLQAYWGEPTWGLPTPGLYPTYTPYAGGNPDYGMPHDASVGDGIHPGAWGHYLMLQRCMEQFYTEWLTDVDHDGLSYVEETHDFDPSTPELETPFDPDATDASGNHFSNAPDGVPDVDNDYDDDGLSNSQELQRATNPVFADTDSDGLSDGVEVNLYHTDPFSADTDGDGYDDAFEIMLKADPLDPSTTIPVSAPYTQSALLFLLALFGARRAFRKGRE